MSGTRAQTPAGASARVSQYPIVLIAALATVVAAAMGRRVARATTVRTQLAGGRAAMATSSKRAYKVVRIGDWSRFVELATMLRDMIPEPYAENFVLT